MDRLVGRLSDEGDLIRKALDTGDWYDFQDWFIHREGTVVSQWRVWLAAGADLRTLAKVASYCTAPYWRIQMLIDVQPLMQDGFDEFGLKLERAQLACKLDPDCRRAKLVADDVAWCVEYGRRDSRGLWARNNLIKHLSLSEWDWVDESLELLRTTSDLPVDDILTHRHSLRVLWGDR